MYNRLHAPCTRHTDSANALIVLGLNDAWTKWDAEGYAYTPTLLMPFTTCQFEYCPDWDSADEKSRQSMDGVIMHNACWDEYDRMWHAAGNVFVSDARVEPYLD